MSSRVFLTLSWVIVIVAYLVGAVGLFLQPRDTGIPAPDHLVAWGALMMFAATMAFALAFARAAMISQD